MQLKSLHHRNLWDWVPFLFCHSHYLIQLHFALFAPRFSILMEFVAHCLPLPVIKLPQIGKFPSLSSANSADPRYDDYDYPQD